jgi:hypothetical protein
VTAPVSISLADVPDVAAKGAGVPRVALSPLFMAREVTRRSLYLPDDRSLLAVLGTVAANRLPGDPVWLVLVGPPGGGKSEQLQTIIGLPDVHPAATLTEASLLSGTVKRERDASAKGGLLREIGDSGIILSKDFGSILSMNRDARAPLLAALREVYDGSWTRHVGADGGRALHWSGKVGLIAGCTPTIDRHHAVMGAMGERFILFRLPEVDSAAQGRRALAHAGLQTTMRSELAAAVASVFSGGLTEPLPRTAEDDERLVALASLVVRCRSSVERDGYTREIELIPSPEAPTRFVVVLAQLLAGLDAIDVSRDEGWSVVSKAALDSIPAIRSSAIETLYYGDSSGMKSSEVAEAISYPTATTRRALEDLAAHGVVEREAGGEGKADLWALALTTRTGYQAATTVPEKSEPLQTPFINPHHTYDDISGKVGNGAT